MGSKDEKELWRARCKAARGALIGAERAECELKINRYLSQLFSYRYATLLLFYAPLNSEVDVFPLAVEAMKKGRRVAFPRCEAEPGRMTFREVRSPEELTVGAFGVREPSADAPVVSKEDLRDGCALLFVPALAFDREGYRLGYGKGYYDRFLSTFGGFSVGVCFGKLCFDELPRGRYDRRVNALVSERGVTICRA